MVHLESIRKIIARYDVDIKLVEHESGRRSLVDIISHRNDKVVIELALTDGRLSEIYFVNNQFYELSDCEFEQLLIDLLDGAYEVRGAGNKRYVVSDHGIGPECMVEASKHHCDIYNALPMWFGRTKADFLHPKLAHLEVEQEWQDGDAWGCLVMVEIRDILQPKRRFPWQQDPQEVGEWLHLLVCNRQFGNCRFAAEFSEGEIKKALLTDTFSLAEVRGYVEHIINTYGVTTIENFITDMERYFDMVEWKE